MTRRLLPLLAALVLLGAIAPAAQGAVKIGIGDQKAKMFTNPYFRALDVRISRLIVSYDAILRGTFEVAEIDAWMTGARLSRVEPLLTLSHSRGCYQGEKGIPRTEACRLPSVARYAEALRSFRERYPWVRVYSPWNEANHRSQPTYKNPRRAAQFYNVTRRLCRGCKIVAADVLDSADAPKYLKQFLRYANGTPRLWGLHNYADANNGTDRRTRAMLRAVKGEIWLTETGGLVKFIKRPYDPARAAKATRFTLELARSNKRITRLYFYNWTGVPRSARFDSGLTHPNGLPRPAYHVLLERIGRPGAFPKAPRQRPKSRPKPKLP
jgi:hypothetical protein